jgi:hypothetical protein
MQGVLAVEEAFRHAAEWLRTRDLARNAFGQTVDGLLWTPIRHPHPELRCVDVLGALAVANALTQDDSLYLDCALALARELCVPFPEPSHDLPLTSRELYDTVLPALGQALDQRTHAESVQLLHDMARRLQV